MQSLEADTFLSCCRGSKGWDEGGRSQQGQVLEGLLGWTRRCSGHWGEPVDGGTRTDLSLSKTTGFTGCGRGGGDRAGWLCPKDGQTPAPTFLPQDGRPPFHPSWEVARPLISCLSLLSEFLARGPCPLFWEVPCLPDPGVQAWLEASLATAEDVALCPAYRVSLPQAPAGVGAGGGSGCGGMTSIQLSLER